MRKKKEAAPSKKEVAASRESAEKKLMEEHPFETSSQVQNRYGQGRQKNGSDGSHQDGRGSNH